MNECIECPENGNQIKIQYLKYFDNIQKREESSIRTRDDLCIYLWST